MSDNQTRQTLVLAACCLGQFMVILDASVVNVALPVIDASLGFGAAGLQWVVNSYTVVLAGFLLLGGRLADLFGQRRVFLLGIGVFTLASLVGGLAYNAGTLIAARAFQGLGAAIMTPATLTVLGTTFTEARQRARAYSLWGAVAGTSGAVGVIAGGVIVQWLSWRWILLVNIPIGAVLFAMVTRALPARDQRSARRDLDVLGALSVTFGLTALVYGIATGGEHGWASPRILTAIGIGAALLAVFLVDQAKAHRPLVPLSIFGNRSLSAANVVGLLSSAAFFSMFYFIALLLQQVLGYTPLRTGLAYLPLSLGIFAGARGVARLVPRLGPRAILMTGQAVAAAGLLWLSMADENAGFLADLFGPCALLGIGQGMVITSLTVAGTAGVPYDRAGLASGLLNTTRQLGCAVGLAALVAISIARTRAVGGPGAADAHATVAGFALVFLVAAGFLVAGCLAALAVPGRQPAPSPSASAAPSAASAPSKPRGPSGLSEPSAPDNGAHPNRATAPVRS